MIQEQIWQNKRINELEDRTVKVTESERQKEKTEESEQSLWDTIKLMNIHTVVVLESKERKERQKVYMKNFLKLQNLMKNMNINIQEAQ